MCACVCMCGGGKGRLEFCCFLESGVLSLPPGKVTLRGVRRLISREAALLSRLRKGELIFFLSALDKQYFITNLK